MALQGQILPDRTTSLETMGIVEPQILPDQIALVENNARHDKTTKERGLGPPESAKARPERGAGPLERGV